MRSCEKREQVVKDMEKETIKCMRVGYGEIPARDVSKKTLADCNLKGPA
jgi:hypothetical protein